MTEHGLIGVVEVEARVGIGESQVGLVEGANGPDIHPIAVEIVAKDIAIMEGMRDDLTAEIVEGILFEDIDQRLGLEHVNAHRAEVRAGRGRRG